MTIRTAFAMLAMAYTPAAPASVQEGIEMAAIGSPLDLTPTAWPAVTAPDGRRAAFVIYAGDVEHNRINYRILVFNLARKRSTPPRQLLTVSSNGTRNMVGIAQLSWDGPEHLLALIANTAGDPRLVRIDLRTGSVSTLFQSSTAIVDYAAARDASVVVTMQHREAPSDQAVQATYAGRVIQDETPYALLSPKDELQNYHGFGGGNVLWVRAGAALDAISLPTTEWPLAGMGLSLSPSGRFVAIPVTMLRATIPGRWDKLGLPASWSFIYGIRLYDRNTKRLSWLVDEPTSWQPGLPLRWSLDERTVFVWNLARGLRRGDAGPAAAVVDVASGHVSARFPGVWKPFDDGRGIEGLRVIDAAPIARQFRLVQTKGRWRFIPQQQGGAVIRLVEGMNSPPKLVKHVFGSNRAPILLDLNPQLRKDRLAHVQEYRWATLTGDAAAAGLYLPPGYKAGGRYPLVIQTHGWNSASFWYDGPSTAGFAAQSLAQHGFVVAQLDDLPLHAVPTQQGRAGTEYIDGLIDALDKDGIIDPGRLGITAWSSTGFVVRHALAFARHRFGAALLVDSRDGGYMSYLLSSPTIQASMDREMGAKPYGDGLEKWREGSPMFNIDRVRTPVRLVKLGPLLLTQWEEWASMKRLKKPIEFIWLPGANHWPINPSERMEVQQGAVDWYRFWLLDEVDVAPEKRAQYDRWSILRGRMNLGSDSIDNASPITR